MRRQRQLQLFAVLVCLAALGGKLAHAATWLPPEGCTSSCDAVDHTCISSTCSLHWDSCPPGLVAIGEAVAQPDMAHCRDNGCGFGGCAPGWLETSSKQCYVLGVPTTRQETCCLLRPQFHCCQRLNCTLQLAGCRIPQQLSLTDTSHSTIEYVSVADGDFESFPFYTARVAPVGSSCDDVRVWGRCQCTDGHPSPGCALNDSSTWLALQPTNTSSSSAEDPAGTAGTDATGTPGAAGTNGTAAAAGLGQRLPANLSLTCVESAPAHAANAWDGDGSTEARHRRSMSKAALVTIIVLSCVLGVLLLGLLVGALLLLRKPAPDTWVDGRLASVYEPVFTGQGYNPVPKTRKLRWPLPNVRDMVGGVKKLLGTRAAAYKEVNEGQTAYSSHRAKLEARFAQRYSLSQPAQPPDAEEEEDEEHGLYTLEDLEPTPPPPRSYHHTGASAQQQYMQYTGGSSMRSMPGHAPYAGTMPSAVPGTEVELGHMKQPPAAVKIVGPGSSWQAPPSLGTRTPAPASPVGGPTGFSASAGNTGSSFGGHTVPHARAGVIMTTPVHLGPPPAASSPAPSPQHTGTAPAKDE